MTIRPLHDKLVIEVIEDEQTTQGGIFIPDSAKEKPQKGKVLAVGAGRILDNGQREPMDVNAGDMILYAKYAGTDVKVGDATQKILSIRDVLGVIE